MKTSVLQRVQFKIAVLVVLERHGYSRLATEQQPAGNRCGRVHRSVDIAESRRNGPQPSTRHDDDDDDDVLTYKVMHRCTDSCRNTSVHSTTSLTCLAVNLFALSALAVWWCLPSSCHLSPTGLYGWQTTNWERLTGWCDVCWVVYIPLAAENKSLWSHFPAISWTLTNLSGNYLTNAKITWCVCSSSKLKNTWFIVSCLEIFVSGYPTTTNIAIRGKCSTRKAFLMSSTSALKRFAILITYKSASQHSVTYWHYRVAMPESLGAKHDLKWG